MNVILLTNVIIFTNKQLELVEEFLPKISIVENVPGILNAKIYIGQDDEDELKEE